MLTSPVQPCRAVAEPKDIKSSIQVVLSRAQSSRITRVGTEYFSEGTRQLPGQGQDCSNCDLTAMFLCKSLAPCYALSTQNRLIDHPCHQLPNHRGGL